MYFITLGEALRRIQPEQFADLMIEQEWMEEPRRLTEILDAVDLLFNQVWYNRHQIRLEKIESGKIKLVETETPEDRRGPERTCQCDIWEGTRKSARKVEKKYGLENLGPWDDFEWGMINASFLRCAGFSAMSGTCWIPDLLGVQRSCLLCLARIDRKIGAFPSCDLEEV